MATVLYKGFTTSNRLRNFRITDFDLAKQDLLNYFNTRRGERLMYPEFGTRIWDLLFDPFDEQLKDEIEFEVVSAIKFDIRLSLENLVINEFEHGIQLALDVRYIVTNQVSQLQLTFDRRSINV